MSVSNRKHLGSKKQSQVTGIGVCVCAKLLWSWPTLCDPMDCSPPSSSVHGIPLAGILEWGAIPFSGGSSDTGIEPTSPVASALQTGSLPLSH